MTDGQNLPDIRPASPDQSYWRGLDPANLDRLFDLLREQLPAIFKANRIIEQRTGYFSEAGRNNLVDALSHISTLAQKGGSLTSAQQATQIAKLEEHLRRAVMEAPEEVVRARIVDVESSWTEYSREATPYRNAGTLRGVPKHDELERLRGQIDHLMEKARRTKPDETTWDDWMEAAADMTEAAAIAKALQDKLEQCVGEALRMTRERERDSVASRRDRKSFALWALALLVTITLTVGGYLIGRHSSARRESIHASSVSAPVKR